MAAKAKEKDKALRRQKPRPGKKGVHGRMPTKRSINLTLGDDNKVKARSAVPSVLIVLVLAALFGKFMVYDRLVAVTEATEKAARLRDSLNQTLAEVTQYGDIEQTYAHYTYEDMTSAEQTLVDRTLVLDLIQRVFPTGDEDSYAGDEDEDDYDEEAEAAPADELEVSASAWSVSDNLLTVEVNGDTLERMNDLVRRLESFPIVDSCMVSTADKNEKSRSDLEVMAKLLVYLQQPPEEVTGP